MNQLEIDGLLSTIIAQAKTLKISGVEVSAHWEDGYSTAVRKGTVETLTHHRSQSISITCYVGQRTGSAATSSLSKAAIHTSLQKAHQIAQLAQEDPFAGLPEASDMALDYPNLDLCHPWSLTPEQAIEQARICEATALDADPRITNTEGVSINNYTATHAYANSHGFIGSYPSSHHSMSCMLLAQLPGKTDQAMERDYDYTVSRNPHDLLSIDMLANNAVKRTVRRLGARQISTGNMPVILAADIARGFVGHLLSAISGGALYRQSSFLLDHLGKPIISPHISLDQRPHEPQALGAAPFDNEGVKTQSADIVTEGILQSYLLSSYSARKLGMTTTGNAGGVHNLYLTSTQPPCTLTELLDAMGTGLLVTELIGQGVNILTGDYSRGAVGFWVEKGQIQYPVHKITIAGNLKDMFNHIRLVGSDIDKRGNIRTGSLLIDGVMVAGSN